MPGWLLCVFVCSRSALNAQLLAFEAALACPRPLESLFLYLFDMVVAMGSAGGAPLPSTAPVVLPHQHVTTDARSFHRWIYTGVDMGEGGREAPPELRACGGCAAARMHGTSSARNDMHRYHPCSWVWENHL